MEQVITQKLASAVSDLVVPKSFGCYSSKGNNALHKKATLFLSKLAKATDYAEVVFACRYWIRAWEAMGSIKTYYQDGVTDTEVRCQVFCFMEEALTQLGYQDDADNIWDKLRGN